MNVILRDVQEDFVNNLRAEFTRHRRVLGVAVTGFGKTVCFAAITGVSSRKGKKVYIVAHRYEIADQISLALDMLGVRHGRIQGGHRRTDDLVQIAMIGTLAKRLGSTPECDLLVFDECHHAVSATYEMITNAWKRTRILGVTATPERLDGRGLGAAFDTMVVAPGMAEMIKAGYLAKYQYLAPPMQIDLSDVKTRMGDFDVDALAAVIDRAIITGDVISHYAKHLNGRPAIAFTINVTHAKRVAEQFRAAGWKAASVDGAMDRLERRNLIESIGDGRLNVLTSCQILSEGVDVPVVAGAILLRPTQSLGLHLQQVGRCLRPKPDGSAAVILDHAGNVKRHGLPDKIHAWSLDSKKKKPAADPVRTCEVCYRVFAVEPGWRAKAECNEGSERPVGCVLNAAEPVETTLPEQVEGTLVPVEISTTEPDWASGIDLATAKGGDWYRLMELADTEPKLRQVAKARGYHWRWAIRRMEEKFEKARKRQAELQEVPFVAEKSEQTNAEYEENEEIWPIPNPLLPAHLPNIQNRLRALEKSQSKPDITDLFDEIISA